LVGFDVTKEVLHHDLTRFFVEEVVGRGDIVLLSLITLLFRFVVLEVLFKHV
jgi:hypothetical protein